MRTWKVVRYVTCRFEATIEAPDEESARVEADSMESIDPRWIEDFEFYEDETTVSPEDD